MTAFEYGASHKHVPIEPGGMEMIRLLKRATETAVKLPFAVAWDCISLGNMGDGSSTGKVLREHQAKKQIDDVIEIAERIRDL